MRDELTAFLSEQLKEAVGIVQLHRIAIGNSRAMFRVDLTSGDRFVVRVEQGGVFATSSTVEFAAMHWLAAKGFPVATVRWLEPTGEVLGQPFFVMDFVEGGPAPEDERTLSRPAAAAFVATLSRLHDLEPPDPGVVFAPTAIDDAIGAQIDRWANIHRDASAIDPLLEEAAAWLHHHVPRLDRLSVVHGDAGPGNLVVDGDEVRIMTDFEFVHLGDRREDWAFCVALRGRRTMPRAEWIALIEQIADVRMDDDEWRYWEAFNLFKGACANLTAADLFERGVNRSPNMAIIGSRVHDVFLRRLADLVI